ncbi:SsrA-binding protein [Bartonella sp. CDC_skunk]|uniref:SsrA-binding protein n=1 Tax=Bartonella rochalimae ATCC BAA-1498 TaxID=685782 RepID=E6YL59_9HYPH|nr:MULTISPECIES: SsrA-binding protein SmpB [Bartonella]AQX18575.1 SsrA-binding protein [Bartonella sp. A1379B]AQX21579.1 SsrA-binding protein [Bartonella sp. CDC_skunk]AQX23089.1 SsrA-binding protein [Bartonella sp. 11B]AQX25544.1 SsrA-binding protein [Bartonella sp. Coyote22sub2]AQX26842.1 SsrA-binding protein [Bartonella sp. Raccoon60]
MNNKKKTASIRKVIADNRKARFNFEILDTLEVGIVLQGTEVKSLRSNHANISESYASFEKGELWLINSHIPEYTQANRFNHDARRLRKLLLSKREMARFFNAISREGMTITPLKLYFNERGRVKLEIALARGKKLHDKRETEKKRDWEREKARLFRKYG